MDLNDKIIVRLDLHAIRKVNMHKRNHIPTGLPLVVEG